MLNLSCLSSTEGYSLHNHSNFSDGAASLEDMCRAGKAGGVKVLGISDHWCVPAYENTDCDEWCMPHGKLPEYIKTLQELKAEYEDENFQLKIGLEVEFFYGNYAQVAADLQKYPLDYMIGSVHYSGVFSIDHDIADWNDLSDSSKDAICQEYYLKLAGAADCGLFTFLGHLDLPKKFGMIDNRKYFQQAEHVLDIVALRGGAIELNTSGWFKQCAEPYPAFELLSSARRRNIPVVISADAHCPEHLQRGFEQAGELLQRAEIK